VIDQVGGGWAYQNKGAGELEQFTSLHKKFGQVEVWVSCMEDIIVFIAVYQKW